MAKKCDKTVDWVSKRQLAEFKLQRLKRIRDRKRRELETVNEQIASLQKEIQQ